MRPLFKLAALAASILVLSASANANSYPNQNVRIIVAAGAGSAPDVLARMVADGLAAKYGKAFVVEPKPGATGMIAADAVKVAKPDGYTLLLADNALTSINKSMNAKLSYDPEKDFAPVTELAWQPFLVFAHGSLGTKSIKDLIAVMKEKPGVLNYGSAGVGSLHHLCVEHLLQLVGAKAQHIQYKTGSEIVRGMLTNEIQFSCSGTSGFQMLNEKANALLVTSQERSPHFPTIPTLKQETGIDGFELVARMGLLAPAGTPREIVEKLSKDIREVFKDPKIVELLARQNAQVATEGPDAYAAVIRSELDSFAKVVKAAGLTPR